MTTKTQLNPSPLYEQWLESANKSEFIASLDDMAREELLAANSHQYYREQEYPPIEDYLDAIVKGNETQKQTYVDNCLAVKTKYPKVSE
jgi:hypothetical protein